VSAAVASMLDESVGGADGGGIEQLGGVRVGVSVLDDDRANAAGVGGRGAADC
jgi:hypothetical protein